MTGRRTLMMVVAHLPPTIGGVEQYAFNLARTLVTERGWRVVLVSTRRPGQDVTATEELVARTPGLSVAWLPAAGLVSNTPVGLGWSRRLRRIAVREGVDVVNAHAPVPGLADVAARAMPELPFVLTYHAGPLRKGVRLLDAVLAGYEREVLARTLERSDAVVAASPWVLDLLPSATDVVTPAVDQHRFLPRQPATRDRHRVLFVGSLEESARYKGVDVLLQAFEQLSMDDPELRLDVVGDGSDRDRLARWVRQRGLQERVRFHGLLQGQELVSAYQSVGVLALPSTFDNFPTVAVEAMACGLAVVCSDVGSLPELIGDSGAGRVVPAGDPTALAEGLRGVLADPDQADAHGRAGRVLVEQRLGLSAQGAQMSAVLERITETSRPTKVAVVAPYYPPSTGGVQGYAERLAHALRDSDDHEVVVLTTGSGLRTSTSHQDGVEVVRLGVWFRLSNSPFSPAWVWQLPRTLRRHNVDVVNAHAPVPGLADITAATATASRPVVLTYHSGTLVKGDHPADGLLRVYERFLLPRVFRAARGLIAVSPASYNHRFGAELIPGGVELDRYLPMPSRSRRLLFVGRIERTSSWKGLHVLVDALPEILAAAPGTELHVVGDGDAVPDLTARAQALGVASAILWHGRLDGAPLIEQYQQATAVVVPSLTAAENAPLVVMEAMACGTPVVASDVGGLPFMVTHDDNGLLTEPGDAASVAQGCITLLGDPERAARLGVRGRATAEEHWSWPRQTSRMIDVIDRTRAEALIA